MNDTMNNGAGKQPSMTSSQQMRMNGGGPEPHQGSNPGAQSDPGPKEVGFYDRMDKHMGGDDGVQNTGERPGQMRMGGIDGSQPNAGQRGGQNTGTSGSQTSAYSSPEEYGAGTTGANASHEPGHGPHTDSSTPGAIGGTPSTRPYDGASTPVSTLRIDGTSRAAMQQRDRELASV